MAVLDEEDSLAILYEMNDLAATPPLAEELAATWTASGKEDDLVYILRQRLEASDVTVRVVNRLAYIWNQPVMVTVVKASVTGALMPTLTITQLLPTGEVVVNEQAGQRFNIWAADRTAY